MKTKCITGNHGNFFFIFKILFSPIYNLILLSYLTYRHFAVNVGQETSSALNHEYLSTESLGQYYLICMSDLLQLSNNLLTIVADDKAILMSYKNAFLYPNHP